MCVRVDGCQRTHRGKDGSGYDGGVVGNYGCDELDTNDRLLLTFATDNTLAIRKPSSPHY